MKKKAVKRTAAVLVTMVVIYGIFIYYLVSACLVPSFMEKLDAFEEITVKGYAEQVHTSDIRENRKAAVKATNEWLSEARGQKLTRQTADGYELVATEFFSTGESHKWVLLLHGYTGWKEEMYPFAYWYYLRGFTSLYRTCVHRARARVILLVWAGRTASIADFGLTILCHRTKLLILCCMGSQWGLPPRSL